MRRFSIGLVAALVAAISGCFTGPSAGNYKPAMSGRGADADIRLRKERLSGELLEVSDSGYVVRNGAGLSLVMYTAVRGAKFSGIGSYDGAAPGPEMQDRLRLVSRFPKGIPPGALKMLLADANQSQLHIVQ